MKWALVFFVLSCMGCKQGKPDPSELAIAVERNDLASTNGLLDRGADPNATGGPLGWLVLSTAADHGQLPIVETLLAHHADPNRVDASLMGLAGVLELVGGILIILGRRPCRDEGPRVGPRADARIIGTEVLCGAA